MLIFQFQYVLDSSSKQHETEKNDRCPELKRKRNLDV